VVVTFFFYFLKPGRIGMVTAGKQKLHAMNTGRNGCKLLTLACLIQFVRLLWKSFIGFSGFCTHPSDCGATLTHLPLSLHLQAACLLLLSEVALSCDLFAASPSLLWMASMYPFSTVRPRPPESSGTPLCHLCAIRMQGLCRAWCIQAHTLSQGACSECCTVDALPRMHVVQFRVRGLHVDSFLLNLAGLQLQSCAEWVTDCHAVDVGALSLLACSADNERAGHLFQHFMLL
jgi:hypothetical protein